MLRLAGTPVSADAAAWLIVQLLEESDDHDAETAALAIDKALADNVELLALSEAQRAAILSVLDDPPEGLGELRGALTREQVRRLGEGL